MFRLVDFISICDRIGNRNNPSRTQKSHRAPPTNTQLLRPVGHLLYNPTLDAPKTGTHSYTCLSVIMRVIAPLLLCLLSALVEIYSQSAPYITFMSNNIPNHGYVDLNTVGSITSNDSLKLQCHTDLTTCCSVAQGHDGGDWYFPNGNRLPLYDYNNIAVLSEARGLQRVIVYREQEGGISGIYRCDIETIAVNNNNGRVSFFVGLYTSGGDVTIPVDIIFTVDSELNGDSPQFTLTCISTGGPATTVTWTRDSETVSGGMTMFNSAVTAQYTHTLTVTGRLGGQYQCNVTNNKPSTATAGFTIQIASSPTGLSAVGDGLTGIRVSWTPPTPLGDTTGYRIYYSGGSSGSEDVSGGSTDNHTLIGLQSGANYNISIVGTSDHFYSERREYSKISQFPNVPTLSVGDTTPTTISLSWTTNGSVVDSYEVIWKRDISGECPDVDEGSATITDESTTYTIARLEEGSNYNITVTITNAAGSAVSVPVTVMTGEAASSAAPASVNVSDVTSFSITVHWKPVICIHRNGDITGYSVQYGVHGSGSTQTVSVVGSDSTETILFGLDPTTDYSIEVAAVNSARTGVYSSPTRVSSEALTTSMITLIDGGKYRDQYDEYIEIQVSWEPVLLGRSTFYLITYYTSSLNKGQLIFRCSEEVPGNTTTITRVVRDPVPGLTHVFTIRSVVKLQSRAFRSEQVNTSIVFDKEYFQLQFGAVEHCNTWTREYAELVERRLQAEIKEVIFKNCSMYRQFNNSVLLRGVFTCQSSPNMATYRSSLLNPGLPGLSNASSLVSYIQDWVSSGPVVRLDWLMVRINQQCPVAIGRLNDPECRPPSLLHPELINTINGVMNTCAVRSLGSQICQQSFWNG